RSFSDMLLKDTLELWRQNDSINHGLGPFTWMSTNSYYLFRLDSPGYSALLGRLRDKMVDNIKISHSGAIAFQLKHEVQRNCDGWDSAYVHNLIRYPGEHSDTIEYDRCLLDSLISPGWHYTYVIYHTGW